MQCAEISGSASSRDVRIRLFPDFAPAANGRFSRWATALSFTLLQQFSRCERTQHKFRNHRLGLRAVVRFAMDQWPLRADHIIRDAERSQICTGSSLRIAAAQVCHGGRLLWRVSANASLRNRLAKLPQYEALTADIAVHPREPSLPTTSRKHADAIIPPSLHELA